MEKAKQSLGKFFRGSTFYLCEGKNPFMEVDGYCQWFVLRMISKLSLDLMNENYMDPAKLKCLMICDSSFLGT